MIFEFFKKLFWKADEGSRKRKTTDYTVYSEENNTYSKKRCLNFASSNHVKITDDSNPNDESFHLEKSSHFRSSLNLKQSQNITANKKGFELLSSPIQWSPMAKRNISKNKHLLKENYSPSQKSESLDQYTLYKTHRLAERKQYSEMLLNFIPSETHNVEDLRKNLTPEHSMKIICSNKNMLSTRYNSNMSSGISKRQSCNPWLYLNRSTLTKTECQKSIPDINLNKKNESLENFKTSVTRCTPLEVIKSNTLRDKFASKKVVKQDFISQITKRYNERMQQRNKEAEELKNMTYILSKHNQLTREAALEEQLNRSMRLCGVVLDERELLEESKLPELNENMMERVTLALSVGSTDEILVQEFGLRITRKDIQTLAGLNWLNDEIINFYMNLLIMRGNSEKYPNVYAMNTFFYPKLISGGHASLKRWTRKIDIFAMDLVVVPIHLGIHWCMSIIDFRNKSIQYYDSMGSPNYKCLQVLKQYLYDESVDKKKEPFDFLDWTSECIKDIPQQMNGSDCGVFSCMFAEYICANRHLNFSQDDMPYFRNKMVYEILTVQLL